MRVCVCVVVIRSDYENASASVRHVGGRFEDKFQYYDGYIENCWGRRVSRDNMGW